ncbi:MAG: hypothetical protein JWO05_1508 [Gemmatimonadetes bacterium]|nr:hypothetical protein [Gemmatimonadota bacterium]
MPEGDSSSRGLGALLRDLASGSATILRGEVQLAKQELSETAAAMGKGTAFFAVGGVLALLGTLSFFAGVILLVGDQWLPRDLYWVAALLVVVITGALAAWLAKQGKAALSPSALAPDQTVATLKEDKEWLKRQLTSGAT